MKDERRSGKGNPNKYMDNRRIFMTLHMTLYAGYNDITFKFFLAKNIY